MPDGCFSTVNPLAYCIEILLVGFFTGIESFFSCLQVHNKIKKLIKSKRLVMIKFRLVFKCSIIKVYLERLN